MRSIVVLDWRNYRESTSGSWRVTTLNVGVSKVHKLSCDVQIDCNNKQNNNFLLGRSNETGEEILIYATDEFIALAVYIICLVH